jgi:hypothetical protein
MEHSELKQAVLKAAGFTNLGAWQCQELSNLIYQNTNRRISVTTLKRLYGFAFTKFNISGYTENALREFVQANFLKKTG